MIKILLAAVLFITSSVLEIFDVMQGQSVLQENTIIVDYK